MTNQVNRRSFLKRAAAATGALAATQVFSSPNILHAANSGEKVRCAVIGCGGRSSAHFGGIKNEHLVAVVDANDKRAGAHTGGGAEAFNDYRPMFDKLHKQIDAVFIATPNHHHAPPSMIAMQLGIGVYCEKPMCHYIGEARKVREMSHKYKVATQMGNQGHCDEGYRRLCELVAAGVIGNITETHSWSDRANGGVGPRPAPSPVPDGMHWDAWIGPAPYREYHKDLDPHEWHGWYDFGNGSLGNMSCHTMDGPFGALKLGHPTSVEAELVFGGTDERLPRGTRIRWDLPARGSLPPVKVYWYDGFHGNDVAASGGKKGRGGDGGGRNFPPMLDEFRAKYPGEKIGDGTLYIGDKGILFSGVYCGEVHVLGKSKDEFNVPKTLPRIKGGSFGNLLNAVREGRTDTAANFDYSAQLTEFILLGNIAQRAGQGKKVEWNGPEMKVTNIPELNQFISPAYRKGWEIG